MGVASNNYIAPYYGAYDANRGLIPFVNPNQSFGSPNTVYGQVAYGQPATPATGLTNPVGAPVVEASPAYTNTTPPPSANTQSQVPTITLNGKEYYQNSKGAMIGLGDNSAYGINENGQSTWNGATGFQWAGLGLQTAFGLFNAYQGYKAQKLAKEQFEDQKRLNHANYRMQAKAFNNNLRNQQSGRGYIGMSGSAKRALGAEYQTRKAEDDY